MGPEALVAEWSSHDYVLRLPLVKLLLHWMGDLQLHLGKHGRPWALKSYMMTCFAAKNIIVVAVISQIMAHFPQSSFGGGVGLLHCLIIWVRYFQSKLMEIKQYFLSHSMYKLRQHLMCMGQVCPAPCCFHHPKLIFVAFGLNWLVISLSFPRWAN